MLRFDNSKIHCIRQYIFLSVHKPASASFSTKEDLIKGIQS